MAVKTSGSPAFGKNVQNFLAKSNWSPNRVNLGTVYEGSTDFLNTVDQVNATSGKKTYVSSVFSYFGDGYSATKQLLTSDQIAGSTSKSLNVLISDANAIESGLRARTGKTALNVNPSIVLYSADKSTGEAIAIQDMTVGAVNGFANLLLQVSYLDMRERTADVSKNPIGLTTIINPDLIKSVDESQNVMTAIKDIDYNQKLRDAINLVQANKTSYSWLPAAMPTPAVESWKGWSGYNKAIGYINDVYAPNVAWGAQMQVYDHDNMYQKERWWGSDSGQSGRDQIFNPSVGAAKAISAFAKAGTFSNGYSPDFITFDKYEADDLSIKGGKPYNTTLGTAQQAYYTGFNYKNYIDYVDQVSKGVNGASPSDPIAVNLWQIPATFIPTKADYVGNQSKLFQQIGYISPTDASKNEQAGRLVVAANPIISADPNQRDERFVTPHMLGFAGTYLFGDRNLQSSSDINPALSTFSMAPGSGVSGQLQTWQGAKYWSGDWAKGDSNSPPRWPNTKDAKAYATTLPEFIDADLKLLGSNAYAGALNGSLPSQIRGIQFGGGETTGLYNYKTTMGSPDYAWAASKATDYLNGVSVGQVPNKPVLASAPSPTSRIKKPSQYKVGFYQQISGDWNADGTKIILNPTKSPGYTDGADEYYLGLLTNSVWGSTGTKMPVPDRWEWSPIDPSISDGAKKGTLVRQYGDAINRPVIPGAQKVNFVLGGDDQNFGINNGNPGIPTNPAKGQNFGRVTINRLQNALNRPGGWDGIDWDEELTSTRGGRGRDGQEFGFDLQNAAALINATPDKHHVWTPMVGAPVNVNQSTGKVSSSNWGWQNLEKMIKATSVDAVTGKNLDGVNLMAYWGGMWNPNIQFYNQFIQTVPGWILALDTMGYDLSKVKLGLSVNVYSSQDKLSPIVDQNGNINPDGKKAIDLYLDLITGTANSFFTDQRYVGKKLGGVFVFNNDSSKPIPKPLLNLIDQRLGTSLASGLSNSELVQLNQPNQTASPLLRGPDLPLA